MNGKRRIDSEEAMIGLGREFASKLEEGTVVALTGDLGAGKTHFCKGVVAGLGSDEDVVSPTFALVREYEGARPPVFHFDFYRIEHESELHELGWEDYLDRGGVVLVEWAERFPGVMPPDAIRLVFEIREDGEREVAFS